MLSVVVDDQARAELTTDLDQLFREGARRMLAVALEAEVEAYIATHAELVDEHGHRLVVRNGHAPARTITTGVGQVEVVRPRVDDRRTDPTTGERQRFQSVILPRWCRRSPKVAEVLPLLYLHGLSSLDFVPALEAFFGASAGLSASVITRLTTQWHGEREAFLRRSLADRDYVYCWADGIHFNLRLEEGRLCCLVIVGVRADGTKELAAAADGQRESTDDWAELLRDCRRRGMRAPVVMVADGALGLWRALREVFPETREQRCWVHKTANVLNALPKSVQAGARRALNEIAQAETGPMPSGPSGRWSATTAPSGPRRSPRWSTTRKRCCASSTIRPSTGCTCAPQIPSSRPSRRCGPEPASPRALVTRTLGWRWCSSCWRRPSSGGGRSTAHTLWPWCGPGPGSSGAGWSSEPSRCQQRTSARSPRDHADQRSTGFEDSSTSAHS
jgi:putative transposase